MSDIPVSLIICTYNREKLLVDTIKCALKQNYKNLEIVIIDQTKKHTKDTENFLNSVNNDINYNFVETPGITKARNLGIRISQGDIIIFIDDDTNFNEHFVSEHVRCHQKGFEIIQGRVIENEDTPPSDKPLWLNWRLKFKGSDNCDKAGPTNTITGCNFSIERKTVEKVGYFDENYTGLAIREDADYGYRCFKKGLKMFFCPEALLKHLKSDTGGVGSGIGNHFFSQSYYYNEMLFCKKHFNKFIGLYYRIRLMLRGKKALRKLIKLSFKQTNKLGNLKK